MVRFRNQPVLLDVTAMGANTRQTVPRGTPRWCYSREFRHRPLTPLDPTHFHQAVSFHLRASPR